MNLFVNVYHIYILPLKSQNTLNCEILLTGLAIFRYRMVCIYLCHYLFVISSLDYQLHEKRAMTALPSILLPAHLFMTAGYKYLLKNELE